MATEPSRMRARIALSLLYLVPGLLGGTWFARIPAVMESHDIQDSGQIGLILLAMSVGSLTVFQVVGRMIARFGSSRVAVYSGFATCVMVTLLALAPTPILLALTLFGVGFSFGGMQVSINAKGVILERHLGHRIMASLHGGFTAGMLIGAALGGFVARAGIGPAVHFAIVAAVGIVGVVAAQGGLLPDPPVDEAEEGKGRHALLPRVLWPLGLMAFCAALIEGAMYDWSALYVHRELGASEATGAYAFAAFSLAVLIGRFGGDRVVDRIGPSNAVRIGSAIAGAGLLAGLAVDTVPAVIGGFAALGLGVSILNPLFYTAAGSRDGVSSARGAAAVATCGMLGLLAGPPVLGLLGDVTSLRLALMVVAIPSAIVVALAGHAEPRPQEVRMPAGSPST